MLRTSHGPYPRKTSGFQQPFRPFPICPTASKFLITILFPPWSILISVVYLSLACRCAKKAQLRGYVHFGLQFYGVCYGGHESVRKYDHYGRSNKCTGQNYQDCDDNPSAGECVGKALTNYVYSVDQGESETLFLIILHR